MSSSRKSRLKELRELSEKEEVLGGSATALKEEDLFINPTPAANDEETNVTIKLRNYVPKDISALKSTSVGVQILPNAVAPEFKRKKEEEKEARKRKKKNQKNRILLLLNNNPN